LLCCLLCAWLPIGAVTSAQERTGKTATGTAGVKVKSDNGAVETLTGCLMIGGGTNFLLTNITARADDNKKPSPAGVSYALTERDGVDLSRYINQQVQLTGVFVPAPPGETTTTSSRSRKPSRTPTPTPVTRRRSGKR